MATTIESLRKLGLKVNGSKPTSDNIGNVINEIADDYQGGSGSAGVSSIGGVDGAITLGTGLSMSGQQLQVSASGGGAIVVDLGTLEYDAPSSSDKYVAQLTVEPTLAQCAQIYANPEIALKYTSDGGDLESTTFISCPKLISDLGEGDIQIIYSDMIYLPNPSGVGQMLVYGDISGSASGFTGHIYIYQLSDIQYPES